MHAMYCKQNATVPCAALRHLRGSSWWQCVWQWQSSVERWGQSVDLHNCQDFVWGNDLSYMTHSFPSEVIFFCLSFFFFLFGEVWWLTTLRICHGHECCRTLWGLSWKRWDPIWDFDASSLVTEPWHSTVFFVLNILNRPMKENSLFCSEWMRSPKLLEFGLSSI